MDFAPPLGHWLKERRQQLGLTQGDLARQAGCATITIRKLESGERRPARLIAERIAECLEIPDAQLAVFVDFATGVSAQRTPSTHGNVPAPLNPLIGRATELAFAQRLLRKHEVRLLTFIGPPGVGKTRLALQVAANAAEHFADGAWFVALASVTDPDLVPAAISAALGVKLDASIVPLDGLKRNLGQKQVLLVLDNFEHLPAAAQHVAVLLAALPGLKVLVTSRTPLHISGEHELAVPPLALPDRQGRQTVEILAHCPAIQLFLQRAQAVQSGFRLEEANAPDIVEIRRHLDGLPLAIELAAARVKLFPPHALLTGLDRSSPPGDTAATDAACGTSFQLLSGGLYDLLPRQQTVWNTIDWSYNLLSPVEQQAFRRLGVFVGGCTPQSAQAVLCTPADTQTGLITGLVASSTSLSGIWPPCIHLLHSLIDKCLLQPNQGPDGMQRYTMLELIREYALTRLNASDEADVVRRLHASYFAQLAETVFPVHADEKLHQTLVLGADYGNLQTALTWCQEADVAPELELGVAVVTGWLMFYDILTFGQHQWTAKSNAMLGHALARNIQNLDTLQSRPRLLHGLMLLSYGFGDTAQTRMLGAETAAAYHRIGDHHSEVDVLYLIGFIAFQENDYPFAARVLNESLTLAREVGDEANAARDYSMIGRIALEQGQLTEAADILTQTLAVWQRLHVKATPFGGVAESQLLLGLIAQLRGDAKQAMQLEEACAQIMAPGGRAWALLYLARAALMEGQVDRAAQCIKEGLPYMRTTDNPDGAAVGLDELAAVRFAQGRTRQAVVLTAAAEPIRRALNAKRPVTTLIADHVHMLAQIQPLLGDPILAAAWAEGECMTMDQALEYALASCPETV